MQKTKEILLDIGMSSYKAETYLGLLKIGSGTIQQIAKVSNVPACKLYENLRWLYENGYVSLLLEKPLTYKANDPRTVLQDEVLKRKTALQYIEEKVIKLKQYVPEHPKDIVQITSSRQAFFTKMKESVAAAENSISYTVKSWRTDAEVIRLFKQKIRKGVSIRALGPITKANEQQAKLLRSCGVDLKHHKPDTTRFSIIDRRLAIVRMRQDDSYQSIWIRSDVLAAILEDYFDLLWKKR